MDLGAVPDPIPQWLPSLGEGLALRRRVGSMVPVRFGNHSNLGLDGCGRSRGSLLGVWKRVSHTLDLEPLRGPFLPCEEVKSEAGERGEP